MRRNSFFDCQRPHNLGIYVAGNFNTFEPRMHPHDERVVTNFVVQAPGVRLKRNSRARA